MDPQLDVNALIRILGGDLEFVAFARAHQPPGLSYNRATRGEFLAGGLGSQANLDALELGYGIVLLADVSEQEIDDAALRLQAAFRGDPLGRVLHLPDARVLATALLKDETVATGACSCSNGPGTLGCPPLSSGRVGRLPGPLLTFPVP
jgi:hypothetical protein